MKRSATGLTHYSFVTTLAPTYAAGDTRVGSEGPRLRSRATVRHNPERLARGGLNQRGKSSANNWRRLRTEWRELWRQGNHARRQVNHNTTGTQKLTGGTPGRRAPGPTPVITPNRGVGPAIRTADLCQRYRTTGRNTFKGGMGLFPKPPSTRVPAAHGARRRGKERVRGRNREALLLSWSLV